MKPAAGLPLTVMTLWAASALASSTAGYRLADVVVVASSKAPPLLQIAAGELRACICRLTGTYPPLAETIPPEQPSIVLRVGPGQRLPTGGPDPTQNFALYAEEHQQVVHGASERSTLWAAYSLMESWEAGGFYLGGDCLRPADPERRVQRIEARGQPAVAIRGCLTWFNLLNSPATWNPQDYRTFFAQLVKQKANLVCFHVYDHEPFGAFDINDHKATLGIPLISTISEFRGWAPPAMATSDFLFGTGLFFDRGEWGCEIGLEDGVGFAPGRAVLRQQAMLAEAMRYARSLGLQTCLGIEATGDPTDPRVREVVRRRLTHILETYPLDFLAIWQPESAALTGSGGTRQQDTNDDAEELWNAFSYLTEPPQQAEAVRMTRYIRLAIAVMKELRPAMGLVVSGWGGDQHLRFTELYEGMDRLLPPEVIFSALDNIDPAIAPTVSAVYGKLQPGRQRWPMLWFESASGHTRLDQTGPQPNVTLFGPLLRDIVSKNCQGMLGVHWRTRNVADVAGYLLRFAWNPELSPADYFRRYASDHYGPADAESMVALHLRLEEFGPQYVGAVGTVEAGGKFFSWFWGGNSPLLSHRPHVAGILPATERFNELEATVRDLLVRARMAAERRDLSAAISCHDLARTIAWVVHRARVGLAIWGEDAPLEEALREAEKLYDQYQLQAARQAAASTLTDLEKYQFKQALQGLASTCRTRGELGMLATANARYGRYYAGFVRRVARILGRPIESITPTDIWDGPPVSILFPVPGLISDDQTAVFDAILLPPPAETGLRVIMEPLGDTQGSTRTLPLRRIGGGCYRAVFFPETHGAWKWELVRESPQDNAAVLFPLPTGVITVRPALRSLTLQEGSR